MTDYEDVAQTILEGRPFAAGLNDLSLEAAFDTQDRVVARLAEAQGGFGGYKIAWNLPALMEKFSMPHPGMGRVMGDQVYQSGVKLPLADYQNLMIETEIIARLSRDLEPGQAHDATSVRNAVDGFTTGFEVLDRLGSPADATAPAIICHNVFNAGLVHGTTWIAPSELDAAHIRTVSHFGDAEVIDGVGKAPQDPFEAIAFLANHFCGRGQVMKAGQLILCGSHIPLYPITQTGRITLSMGPLGDVNFEVV